MSNIDKEIFRKNDIRGIAIGINAQLTSTGAELIGKALGSYLPAKFNTKKVYIGCDNRVTSPNLKSGLINGLISVGMDVCDIGQALTPMIYFASAYYGDTTAGIMITGSHLSVDYNGIKIVTGNKALAGQQITDLYNIIKNGSFNLSQSGSYLFETSIIQKYLEVIQKQVNIGRNLSVVIDAGNSLSGIFIPPILENLGITVHCLYCDSDGNYPNHLPNPEITENMDDLGKEVLRVGADLGIAFDGDADRVGLVDNKGVHIPSDRLIVPLAKDFLSRNPDSTIVLDVKTSQVVNNIIKKFGGNVEIWKTGHSLTMLRMKELHSLLGSDAHGHLYFGENYYGYDDAPLAALKLIEYFSKTNETVHSIFGQIPHTYMSPEIIISIPEGDKGIIIDMMKTQLKKHYKIIEIDGAKILFENGWGLIRASNSQSAITLKFESSEIHELVSYIQTFKELLDKIDINTKLLTEAIAELENIA